MSVKKFFCPNGECPDHVLLVRRLILVTHQIVFYGNAVILTQCHPLPALVFLLSSLMLIGSLYYSARHFISEGKRIQKARYREKQCAPDTLAAFYY